MLLEGGTCLQEIHSAERASKETLVRSWEELHGSQTCPQRALPLFGNGAVEATVCAVNALWITWEGVDALHGRPQVSGCPTASGGTKAAAVVIVLFAAL